jgi:hypothetical protein
VRSGRHCITPQKNVRQTSVCRETRFQQSACDKLKFVGHRPAISLIQPIAPINQKIVLPLAYSTLAAEVIKDWLFAAINTDHSLTARFRGRNVGKIISIPG